MDIDPHIDAAVYNSNVCDTLEALYAKQEADTDLDNKVNFGTLTFCIEHLRLICTSTNRRRYSSDMLKFAFLIQVRSSACCKILYSRGTLALPFPRTLSKLASAISMSPGVSSSEQVKYLQASCSQLQQCQKYVALQLDEIHINPSLTYKGGDLSGLAENSDREAAHKVQAFMISSIFGSFSEIAGL